ncbi:MAG: single-stranded DNA-binding protein [Candidatus Borkfalkiaceae bacterium]|nr:single-stranded DNA-binding protein [Christensenellaceae bacterium]
MNKVYLIGNLTRDPEVSETGSGLTLCRFSIAVNRNYSSSDGERQTDFFNITVWRALAENCGKYLKKGSKVAVVGSLQNRSYEDKDGIKRNVTDIVANEVEFLSSKNSGEGDEDPAPRRSMPSKKPELEVMTDDDTLPF